MLYVFIILYCHSKNIQFFIIQCIFYLTKIIVRLHYIPVDHRGEYNINREGLLTIGLAVISIGRV